MILNQHDSASYLIKNSAYSQLKVTVYLWKSKYSQHPFIQRPDNSNFHLFEQVWAAYESLSISKQDTKN